MLIEDLRHSCGVKGCVHGGRAPTRAELIDILDGVLLAWCDVHRDIGTGDPRDATICSQGYGEDDADSCYVTLVWLVDDALEEDA